VLTAALTLQPYVSLRAVIPGQVKIDDYGIVCMGNNYIYGIYWRPLAAQKLVEIASNSSTATIDFHNCTVESYSTKPTFYDAGSTSSGKLRVRDCPTIQTACLSLQAHLGQWTFTNCGLSLALHQSTSGVGMETYGCVIDNCSLTTVSPGMETTAILVSGSSLSLRDCDFTPAVAAANTAYLIRAATGTVKMRNCRVDWSGSTAEDYFSVYAGDGTTINVMSSALGGEDRIGSAGTGAVEFDEWLGDALFRTASAEAFSVIDPLDEAAQNNLTNNAGTLYWGASPVQVGTAADAFTARLFLTGAPQEFPLNTDRANALFTAPAVTTDTERAVTLITIQAQTVGALTGSTTLRISNKADFDDVDATYADVSLPDANDGTEFFTSAVVAVPILSADRRIWVRCMAAGGHANITLEAEIT
jgi:hypothetical protein